MPVYPLLLSLGLQLFVGIFLWRVVIRKTVNPFQPALFRWEAVALFAIFVLCQHGLIWGEWRGSFPAAITTNRFDDEASALLPIVHCGTMLLALIILASTSPMPESIRLKAMRLGLKTPGAIFPYSSVPLALVLTIVTAIIFLTQFIHSWSIRWAFISSPSAIC